MSNEVVLDIETRTAIGEVPWDELRVSVVVAYYYDTDVYEAYLEEDLPKLFKRLEGCSRIIGYNSVGFDMPVLNRYYPGDLLQIAQLDMLAKIYTSLGFRIKLDSVASATIGVGKSAHGLQAVQWWKEGRVEEVIEYCKQDVKVTKEVYEFGRDKGFLLFDDRMGERRQVEVDFSVPADEKSSINLTMGF
ncbi:MAG: ribonuclease H-like domain-containing protein [Candidatus Uhrbacteria bacterium]|nr:ribonuclease H-like domain-containing protein [Candidatus Uhrbacteria bacterium]